MNDIEQAIENAVKAERLLESSQITLATLSDEDIREYRSRLQAKLAKLNELAAKREITREPQVESGTKNGATSVSTSTARTVKLPEIVTRGKRWSDHELALLYTLKQRGETFKNIGKQINRTRQECGKVYSNVDWLATGLPVLTQPEAEAHIDIQGVSLSDLRERAWTTGELEKLYNLRVKEGQPYPNIARQLNRGENECRKKFRSTEWNVSHVNT